jgi:K+-sensing histidine kinase KdpD
LEPDLPRSFFSTIGGRREALPADAPGVAIRYAVAVALAVLGVVITATVGDLAEEAPYLISISVVMVVSWFGGFGPGVVASALSALGVDYFATEPLRTLTILDRENLVLVGAFLTATWLISWLNAARLRAEAEGETLLRQEQDARREAITGRNRMSFLAEASAVLAVSLDYRATLRQVAHLVVPTLADWCAVHIVGEDGEVSQLEVAHVDPSKVEWVRTT